MPDKPIPETYEEREAAFKALYPTLPDSMQNFLLGLAMGGAMVRPPLEDKSA